MTGRGAPLCTVLAHAAVRAYPVSCQPVPLSDPRGAGLGGLLPSRAKLELMGGGAQLHQDSYDIQIKDNVF